MFKNAQKFQRLGFLVAVIALAVAVAGPSLLFKAPNAVAAQVTSRKIVMSNSTPSTAASYAITFTPVTTTQELIIDFCSNDPLYNDACNFSASTVPTVASPTASTGTASSVGSGSPVHTIKVTGLTVTGGSPYTITISSGITNPTTATSFYARILTYATGNASGYTPANTSGNTPTAGTFVDYGGDALSTVSNISITAKVFETLSFCVYTGSCGTAPSLTLGDTTTGALSTSNAYVNAAAKYNLATNAGGGVNVTMTGQTLCRASTLNFTNCPTGASANTISAVGATPAAISTGTEQFGMCVDVSGTSLTAGTDYTDSINSCHSSYTTGTYSGTSKFGFDDTSGANGTNGTSGSQVMSSSGAVSSVTGNQFAFFGDIAATTEAGIYQSNLNMVATGTF